MQKGKSLPSLMLLALLVSAAPRIGFAAEWKDKAEAEGQLVFYTTANAADAKAITDGFKKLYPKVDVRFDRTSDSQLMEKILTEARAGKSLWDVAQTTGFYGYLLKKRGLLAAYDSPERKYFRDGFKDSQGFWTSTYTTYAVFGYNTRLVSKANIPRSYEDLLKPAWRGQFGLEGRAYEWFTATISGMGREKGLGYMRALAKQQPDLRIGRTLLAQLVAAGEFNGTLTAYMHNFDTLKAGGAPVEWVPLAPSFANLHPVGISAKAAHPNAAKLFVDYVLSQKGQELVRALKRIPDRIDTPPDPPTLLKGVVPAFTAPEIYDDFDRYIKLFQEIFGVK
ncbi:MAG TPA: extracellular solute-binding protein [Candidatus Binatia bacterium]|nr:extracellular solute-binding protein [Candidatus Binatia bacterium]